MHCRHLIATVLVRVGIASSLRGLLLGSILRICSVVLFDLLMNRFLGLPSPLQFPSMPRNGHEMSDLQLSSDVSQVSMKKPLVVSYTDQNFEPKGGIYVGYSRDTAPGRRKPDEKVEKAVSNKPANSPLLNTATGLLGVGNKSVKRGSFSSVRPI